MTKKKALSNTELKRLDESDQVETIYATETAPGRFLLGVKLKKIKHRYVILTTRNERRVISNLNTLTRFVRQSCPVYLARCVKKKDDVVRLNFEP